MRVPVGVITLILLAALGRPHPVLAQSEAPAVAAGWTEPRIGVRPARDHSPAGSTFRAPGEALLPDPTLSGTGLTLHPLESSMNTANLSARRHLAIGSGVGAVLGLAFGAAVVAFADCSGSHCFGERVMGVVGHGLAGAAAGALVGGAVYLVRRTIPD